MKNINPFVIAALLMCAVSLWGCNQQKSGAISNKIRELETRNAKLEDDYRALQAANEQHRKRLNAVEAQRDSLENEKADLAKQLETVSADRESLKKQISQRTVERDAAQNHLIQFSKDLQALAGRVEAAANTPSPNVSILPASRRTE